MRVVLLNAGHLKPRIEEISWWLRHQLSMGAPIDALMLTEPILDEPYVVDIPHMYTITSPNPKSTLSNNKHFPTCCITNDDSESGTVAEWENPFPHLGMSCVRMSFYEKTQAPLYMITAYIPNPSAPVKYTESLYAALEKNVSALKAMGASVLIGMDCNVPFKYVGHVQGGRNYVLLMKFLTNQNLTILNWEPRAKGFHTRTRGGASHQLDIMIGCHKVKNMVESITISEKLTFGSDHCAVILNLTAKAGECPKLKPQFMKNYTWSEDSETKFQRELDVRLPIWETVYAKVLAEREHREVEASVALRPLAHPNYRKS